MGTVVQGKSLKNETKAINVNIRPIKIVIITEEIIQIWEARECQNVIFYLKQQIVIIDTRRWTN